MSSASRTKSTIAAAIATPRRTSSVCWSEPGPPRPPGPPGPPPPDEPPGPPHPPPADPAAPPPPRPPAPPAREEPPGPRPPPVAAARLLGGVAVRRVGGSSSKKDMDGTPPHAEVVGEVLRVLRRQF